VAALAAVLVHNLAVVMAGLVVHPLFQLFLRLVVIKDLVDQMEEVVILAPLAAAVAAAEAAVAEAVEQIAQHQVLLLVLVVLVAMALLGIHQLPQQMALLAQDLVKELLLLALLEQAHLLRLTQFMVIQAVAVEQVVQALPQLNLLVVPVVLQVESLAI
jgi:hypothetical protein